MWTPPACAPSLPLSSWLHGPCLQGGLPPAGLLLLPTPGTGPLVAFSSHPSSRSEEALTPLQAGPGPGLDVPGPPSPAEGGLQTLFGTSVPQPGQAHIRHPTSCVPRRGHDRAGMGRPLLQPQARWGAGDSREAALSPGGQLGVVLQLGPALSRSSRGQGSCLLSPSSLRLSGGHHTLSGTPGMRELLSIFPSCSFRAPGAADCIGHQAPHRPDASLLAIAPAPLPPNSIDDVQTPGPSPPRGPQQQSVMGTCANKTLFVKTDGGPALA